MSKSFIRLTPNLSFTFFIFEVNKIFPFVVMTFTSSLYEPAVAMKTFQLIYCVRENVLTLLAAVPSSFVFYFLFGGKLVGLECAPPPLVGTPLRRERVFG